MASKERPEVSFNLEGCQHQFGWVEGSKKDIDLNEKKESQDASGDGFIGCVKCGKPALIKSS